VVLSWFTSYLQGRKQQIRINDALSPSFDLSIGVPQGSVLGPLLFLCYILPIQHIVERYGILRHGYADDTQLYCRLSMTDTDERKRQLENMENCLVAIRHWMLTNKLKLNEEKTEALVAVRKSHLDKVKDISVRVGNAVIKPKNVVKNLGALFDTEMSMKPQVMDVARRVCFHLRSISHIRPYLSEAACARAINASVVSRLDFHNGLLLGAPKCLIRRLQVIQNSAARILTKTAAREHITPTLAGLHWLPIEKRVEFKALCMVHDAVHNGAPRYLADVCRLHHSERDMRSVTRQELVVPRVQSTHGDRAFSHNAVKRWNELPQNIRDTTDKKVFKKILKTLFFIQSYMDLNFTTCCF